MSQALSQQVVQQIANEINAKAQQVNAAIQLLDGGATVPFIARYRKELTGSLDDQQLRVLFQRVTYLRELQQRRDSIRQSLSEQNQLSDALNQALNQANTKSELEDIYLPFKPKRNNKALLAKQAGLTPLFEQLLCQSHQDPTKLASKYCKTNSDFDQSDKVLEGIKYLLIEQLQTQPEVRSQLRQLLTKTAVLQSKVVTSKAAEASKFRDYFDYQEAWRKIPSHRALAMFRGKGLGFLRLKLDLLDPPAWPQHPVQRLLVDVLAHAFPKLQRSTWLSENLEWAWKQKLRPALENELLSQLRQQAEEEAIQVFAKNLHALLMAAPAGPLVTIGLDPGIRTGVKVVVLDATGKLLEYCTIYPHQPKKQWQSALAKLQQLIKRHQVSLIAIGNGTGSRETQDLVKQALQEPEYAAIQQLIVSEAGASVYSASELAAAEFPELDVSIRGAVSIARRLQDPLAELVKIDPKAIGVGSISA